VLVRDGLLALADAPRLTTQRSSDRARGSGRVGRCHHAGEAVALRRGRRNRRVGRSRMARRCSGSSRCVEPLEQGELAVPQRAGRRGGSARRELPRAEEEGDGPTSPSTRSRGWGTLLTFEEAVDDRVEVDVLAFCCHGAGREAARGVERGGGRRRWATREARASCARGERATGGGSGRGQCVSCCAGRARCLSDAGRVAVDRRLRWQSPGPPPAPGARRGAPGASSGAERGTVLDRARLTRL